MFQQFLESNWFTQIITTIFVINLIYFILYIFVRAIFKSYFDAKKSFLKCMFVATLKTNQEIQLNTKSDRKTKDVGLEATK